MSARLFDGAATTDGLAAIFSDTSFLRAMVTFEAALARAAADAGLVPAGIGDLIEQAATAADFDVNDLVRAARDHATIGVGFVDMLRARVAVRDAQAARFVHWGATSQDVTDTALTLCLAAAREVIRQDHAALLLSLRELSDRHAGTAMLGRTLLQPAAPITFGLKVAGWYAATARAGRKLDQSLDETAVLQFGGPTGTLAAFAEHGPTVAASIARALRLRDGGAPWHAQRDRFAQVVSACGIYCGVLGKIARDVTLLMQAEVGEAAEAGGGRSSSMPHKRNPAGCAIALAAAARMPGLVATLFHGLSQEHERGLGTWVVDAPTIADAIQTTGASLAAMRSVIGGLSVDDGRMRANLSTLGAAAENAPPHLGSADTFRRQLLDTD